MPTNDDEGISRLADSEIEVVQQARLVDLGEAASMSLRRPATERLVVLRCERAIARSLAWVRNVGCLRPWQGVCVDITQWSGILALCQ